MKKLLLSFICLSFIFSFSCSQSFVMPTHTVGISGGAGMSFSDEVEDENTLFGYYGLFYENRFYVTDDFTHSAYVGISKSGGWITENDFSAISGSLFYKFGWIWDTPHGNYVSYNVEYQGTSSSSYGLLYIAAGVQADKYLKVTQTEEIDEEYITTEVHFDNDYNFYPAVGIGVAVIGEYVTWNMIECYYQYRMQKSPQPEIISDRFHEWVLVSSLGINF